MKDIVEKMVYKKRERLLRRATGKVNGKEIVLELWGYSKTYCVHAEITAPLIFNSKIFITRWMATIYFNKLVKKYGLSAEDVENE